jgi:hypothetical protein
MEEKKIIAVFSAFILVITASFLNSENLSKSQKLILFCLTIFPPAQWVLGIVFLNFNKKSLIRGKEFSDEISINTKIRKEDTLNTRSKNNNLEKLKEKEKLNIDKFNRKRKMLEESFEMKLITKIEFETKINNLEQEKNTIEEKIKNSEKVEEKKILLQKLYDNKIITKEELTLKIQELLENSKNSYYEITEEVKGWSLMTGNYIEFYISFKNYNGSVLYIAKKEKFCFIKTDSSEYFDNLEECILNYKNFLEKKQTTANTLQN